MLNLLKRLAASPVARHLANIAVTAAIPVIIKKLDKGSAAKTK